MMKIEFKQSETESAIALLRDLRNELIEAQNSGDASSENGAILEDKELARQHEIWGVQYYMKVQILKDAIEKLETDIITQSFNF